MAETIRQTLCSYDTERVSLSSIYIFGMQFVVYNHDIASTESNVERLMKVGRADDGNRENTIMLDVFEEPPGYSKKT